ncbi:hypothetical protein SORBI_3005G127300 [Sorghum bicolor]|uniref:Exportin-5 C-terminal domain-containing protein n=1 Tax=Sorghum bicolor TaxID=4558 RepID=A0A1Z5RJ91_SORBI|nr:hypothetical protein SORBI_3005G127300 [Sorghum bicolor]
MEERQGYADTLLRTTLQLLLKGVSPEIRRQGLNLMLHLLRYRWDELCIEEWSASSDVADLVAGLHGATDISPSKNAIAALMAEVIWSGGISLLNALLPSIIILAKRGPAEAELAALIFKWISDFGTVCTVDLEGGQSEAILCGLDEALPSIMVILSSLLEKYGGSFLTKHPEQLTVSSKKHGLTVAACLLAANAYAEWVPVVHLAKYGLVERCKSFLYFSNPHVLALSFFKVICQRRRPPYDTEDYDTIMSLVFWSLINISKDFLISAKTHCGLLDECLLDFTGRICECLIALGSFNMQFIIKDRNRAPVFFRQMLEYYQHDKIALHFRCLQFWLMVLKELPKEKYVVPYPGPVASPASLRNSTEKGNNGAMVFVSDDICDGMLDISFKRILKKSEVASPELMELCSDEVHGKNGFLQYHSLLLDLITFIAYERPIIAAKRAVQRITCVIGDVKAGTTYPKDLVAIESAQLGLETVVSAIFDDAAKSSLDVEFPSQRIHKIFERLLLQFLSLNWTEPKLVIILGHYLDALCPFLRHFPDAVGMVVAKLLELLSSINVDCHDPSKSQCARLQICSGIIHISQVADGASLPSYMKDLFSIPHITEEDVLAFVESNITAYSVEQKQACEEWNQDGGATHTSSGSSVMTSPSTHMTSELCPWAQNVQSPGLYVALSYFHDLPTMQPSFNLCSLFPISNGIALTLNQKKLNHNLIHCPRLYYTSFPHHGSVPISWLRLGTKSYYGNEAKSLNLSPEYQISTHVSEGSTQFVSEINLGIVGTMSCHQEKGQLLLLEHNILSEVFVNVTSFPRMEDVEHLLPDLLGVLNKIWTQSDWENKYMRYTYCISGLFGNDQFRRTVHSLVKSFENLLGGRIVEFSGICEAHSLVSADYLYSSTLPKLMLPLILRILRCIQMLWREPNTYDLSAATAEDISFILENGKLLHSDEAEMLQNAKRWSQEIRATGYNVIRLCASVKGAFYGLLDRSSIIEVLTGNLRSMEFNHLGKLIQVVFIPLIKYCPHECWDEWMVELLEPVFSYCEEIFYYAWFTFLHEGRAKVTAYLGNPHGPEEIVNQFEKETLLKFTRSVSELLGVLASEKMNSSLSLLNYRIKTSMKADVQDLESISSSSIIGYLLLHNCFGRFSMYMFGCLVDYQAVENALPFCYSLVHLARATNHARLNQFILNEMLPTIILLLGVDVKSAISQLSCSLNSTRKEDARNNVTRLCQEIYEVYIDSQVIVGTNGVSDRFKGWLAKELEYLHKRASCAVPVDFPEGAKWDWELNEEFERYLPTYMSMLEEVDAMDGCLKDNYLDDEILFEKLRPEFKSMYGIDSYLHPYLNTMTCMLQRKMPAVYYWKRINCISQHLNQLITLKPYVKRTDSWGSILKRLLENYEPQSDLVQCNPASVVDIFRRSLLFYWEPQFHPLIREAHQELLKTIACQLALADKSVMFEPLEPHPHDFLEHLQPYACMYIKRKKQEFGYFRIEEQVRMHEEFDHHLASGILDHRLNEFNCSKDDFVHNFAVNDLANSSFATLEHDLISMSFERRAKIVEWEDERSLYSECIIGLLNNDEMKDELGSLLKMLDAAGFFSVNDDMVDWNNRLFSDSIDKFNEMVFPGRCVGRCLVIQGIMDYQKIMQMKDVAWQDAFKMVVSNTIDLWKENLRQVFLMGGAPKPRYG